MSDIILKKKIRNIYLVRKACLEIEAGWKDLTTGLALVLNTSFLGVEDYLDSAKDLNKFLDKAKISINKIIKDKSEIKEDISLDNNFTPSKDGGSGSFTVNIGPYSIYTSYSQKDNIWKKIDTKILENKKDNNPKVYKTLALDFKKKLEDIFNEELKNKKIKNNISLFRRDLSGIINHESSGGTNINHKMIKDPGIHYGTRAAGYTGIMPATVRDILKQNKELNKKYDFISKMSNNDITEFLNKHTEVEADFANYYWDKIKRKFKEHPLRVYAWNHGIQGTIDTIKNNPKKIFKSDYVKKVLDLESKVPELAMD